MSDVMLDIETLDTNPNCVVLTLGAVKFNPFSNEIDPNECLYIKLDVDQQIAMGRNVNDGTIGWWSTQPKEVYEDAMAEEGRTDLQSFCKQLNKFVANAERIWAQGPVFDIVILENLYKQLGNPVPWPYYSIRDSRTLLKALGDNREPGRNQAHNALADCIYQVQAVQAAIKKYNLTSL